MGCCKTPTYTFFATLVGFVGTDWEKSCLDLNTPPKSVLFALMDPHQKTISAFLIIITKVGSLPTFLCRKFVSKVFSLSCMALWMDAVSFHSLREKRFSPETTSHVRGAYRKICILLLRIQRYLHWLSSSIRSEVKVAQRSRALKGLWNIILNSEDADKCFVLHNASNFNDVMQKST